MSGLISCYRDRWINGFCQEKFAEFGLSTILAIIIILQYIVYCKRDCLSLKTRYTIMFLAFLALVCNSAFCLWHDIRYLFYLSTFFFNIYYVSIVCYVSYLFYSKKYQNSHMPFNIVISIFMLFTFIFVFLFIDAVVAVDARCEQIWYVIVRLIGIVLSVILFVMAKLHQNKEKKRLLSLLSVRSLNNPLPRLWAWIGLNIIAQLINVIESIIFVSDPSLKCRFNESDPTNYLISFMMVVITFQLPFASTIYIFWTPLCGKSVEQINREREQTHYETHKGIQLIKKQRARQDSL